MITSNNFSTLCPFRMHASCHYMPFKRVAAYSVGRFLEAIRRNSALPWHSTVVVTRPSIAEIRCTRGMREAFGRYIAAMRRKSCNRTSFPSYAAMSIKRRSVTSEAWNSKIKCMSYFYIRNWQHGLVNSYVSVNTLYRTRRYH